MDSILKLIGPIISNAIGHKATTIAGLIAAAIMAFVTASSTPDAAGIVSPTVLQILGYVGALEIAIGGAAAKNPNS